MRERTLYGSPSTGYLASICYLDWQTDEHTARALMHAADRTYRQASIEPLTTGRGAEPSAPSAITVTTPDTAVTESIRNGGTVWTDVGGRISDRGAGSTQPACEPPPQQLLLWAPTVVVLRRRDSQPGPRASHHAAPCWPRFLCLPSRGCCPRRPRARWAPARRDRGRVCCKTRKYKLFSARP